METKTCSICGEDKKLEDFYFNKGYSKKRGNYIHHHPYCKECEKKKNKEWSMNNKEAFQKSIEKRKAKPSYKEYHKRYNKEKRDKEKMKEYMSNWRKEHADIMNIHNQTKRNARRQLRHDLTFQQWKETLEEFDYACAYCGIASEEAIEKYGQVLHQEHVIPVTENGEYTKSNIIPACRGCNCSKHNQELHKWYSNQDFYDKEKEEKILDFANMYLEGDDYFEQISNSN